MSDRHCQFSVKTFRKIRCQVRQNSISVLKGEFSPREVVICHRFLNSSPSWQRPRRMIAFPINSASSYRHCLWPVALVLGILGLAPSVASASCGDHLVAGPVAERYRVPVTQSAELPLAGQDVVRQQRDSSVPGLPCRGPSCQRGGQRDDAPPVPRITRFDDARMLLAGWAVSNGLDEATFVSLVDDSVSIRSPHRLERPPRG
jgi:hypothetical protein